MIHCFHKVLEITCGSVGEQDITVETSVFIVMLSSLKLLQVFL